MGLAQALRERRRLDGLTQEEAAAKLGVSQQTVAKWETGATRPARKRDVTEAIAAYLGIDYREALVLIDEEPVGAERSMILAKLDEFGERLTGLEAVVYGGAGVTPRYPAAVGAMARRARTLHATSPTG